MNNLEVLIKKMMLRMVFSILNMFEGHKSNKMS